MLRTESAPLAYFRTQNNTSGSTACQCAGRMCRALHKALRQRGTLVAPVRIHTSISPILDFTDSRFH